MIRRIVDFYRLQIHVMRTWRPSGGSRFRRILVTLVMSVVAFALAVMLTPGITIQGDYGFWTTSIVAAVFLGILNVAVRPLFIALFASVSVIAVFAATLVFQIASFFVLPFFVSGLQVGGLVAALIGSLIYAFVLTILTAIFSVSQDDSYWSLLVQQLASRDPNVVRTDQPGLVVIQVDGLPHDVLSRQVRAGRVPHMSRWLRSEKYRLSMWDALLPPTTPASQAGILHGNNDGIPAFRWYEKDSGKIMVANHPDDALVIGQRISDGEGLLSNGGASVGNLFSGDAARSYMTMATIKDKSQGLGKSQTFFSFFASPTNYLHTLVLFVAEIGKEYVQARRQERAGIVPRMHRGMPYPVARAATNVALRNLSTALVIEEMYRGASTIYVDYTDYDEIAHHSGPERPESLDALDGVDQALATLEKASAQAPRPYRFVVVSDHGQSLGATFLQRYGKTLGDVIRELMGGEAQVAEAVARVEEWGQTNAFLSEVTQVKGVSGRLARTALRNRTENGVVELGPTKAAADRDEAIEAAKPEDRPDMIWMASGNLGLVFFPPMPGRATVEQIAAAYPGMVEALANHPGVGAMLIRSAEHGAIVVGRDGIHYLDEERIEGTDPVAQFGGKAREAFLRLDGMQHCPDISVVSMYDPEFDEIAAFEELIGAHGGLGGPQVRPILMYPAEWELDEEIVGAEAVYRQIRRWAERELGLRFGPDGSAAPLPKPERKPAKEAPAA
ncbi:MAG: alkaline phosphatase family protein [Chloroflexi bacterium]|jgi:uncharacterized membrane protein YvlD (DUF360 family)|nr:alkaline phosphatase family protein [Chloroflexota bacterium]